MKATTDKKKIDDISWFQTVFVKNLPEICQADQKKLNVLLKKDIVFYCDQDQENCFNWFNKMVSTAPVLKYYDPDVPFTLSVQGSSKGSFAEISQQD